MADTLQKWRPTANFPKTLPYPAIHPIWSHLLTIQISTRKSAPRRGDGDIDEGRD